MDIKMAEFIALVRDEFERRLKTRDNGRAYLCFCVETANRLNYGYADEAKIVSKILDETFDCKALEVLIERWVELGKNERTTPGCNRLRELWLKQAYENAIMGDPLPTWPRTARGWTQLWEKTK